jgi:hypothetical protein
VQFNQFGGMILGASRFMKADFTGITFKVKGASAFDGLSLALEGQTDAVMNDFPNIFTKIANILIMINNSKASIDLIAIINYLVILYMSANFFETVPRSRDDELGDLHHELLRLPDHPRSGRPRPLPLHRQQRLACHLLRLHLHGRR